VDDHQTTDKRGVTWTSLTGRGGSKGISILLNINSKYIKIYQKSVTETRLWAGQRGFNSSEGQ